MAILLRALTLTLCSFAAAFGLGPAMAAESGQADPSAVFSQDAQGAVIRIDEADMVGLYNDHIGVVIRREDGVVMGVQVPGQRSLVDNTTQWNGRACPLWRVQVMPKDAAEPIGIEPAADSEVRYRFEREETGRTILKMSFAPSTTDGHGCRAIATVALAPEDTQLHWRIEVQPLNDSDSIWEVAYPRFFVKAADSTPETNYMVIPYRRGRIWNYGAGFPRYHPTYPYPGAAVKYQFLAAYGENSGDGYYLAVHDSEGYRKIFKQDSRPSRNGVLMCVSHKPVDRGVPGTGFKQPYDVVTQPYRGDWWHAARIYRQWWIQQPWAGKGLLRDRQDIPEAIKRSQVMTRPSTSVKGRTVENNLRGLRSLREIVGERPIVGTWYGAYQCLGEVCSIAQSGQGHQRPLEPGVASAVQSLQQDNIYMLAYIQSVIYHSNLDTLRPEYRTPERQADVLEASKWVVRRRDGKAGSYHGNYAMDRDTAWWQDRLIEQARRAVEAGFDGIYLDSFGKSSGDCYDPNHGHPLGGGNAGVAGQREMAHRMLEAIRKINPNAVLSGEAPIGAFRDVLHIYLQAATFYGRGVPITRTIWGDYGLSHGRVLRPAKQGPENVIPEISLMFLEGTMIGRIYTDSGNVVFDDPAMPPEAVDHFKQILAYGDAGIEYLRFGEYLHPLNWKEPLPTFLFHESVQYGKIRQPVILHSVTRHQGDGSVAIVLVNIHDQPYTIEVPIDPSRRAGDSARNPKATLWRMDADGRREQVRQGTNRWYEKIEMQPREIVFFILD